MPINVGWCGGKNQETALQPQVENLAGELRELIDAARTSIASTVNFTITMLYWQDNDPYSALAIFSNDQDEFLGHIMLGPRGGTWRGRAGSISLQNEWEKN